MLVVMVPVTVRFPLRMKVPVSVKVAAPLFHAKLGDPPKAPKLLNWTLVFVPPGVPPPLDRGRIGIKGVIKLVIFCAEPVIVIRTFVAQNGPPRYPVDEQIENDH